MATRSIRPGALPRLAVVLHDIEPSTFEHCALIRDWLGDLGVERVTLCLASRPGGDPLRRSSPALAAWLQERRQRGDAVAPQDPDGQPPRGRHLPWCPEWWLAAGLPLAIAPRMDQTLRVGIRPRDFERHPRRTRLLERRLRRAARHCHVVTVDELPPGDSPELAAAAAL